MPPHTDIPHPEETGAASRSRCGRAIHALLLTLLLLAAPAGARAQEPAPTHPPPAGSKPADPSAGGKPADSSAGGIAKLLPPDATSRHSVALAGGPLEYSATAGTLPARDAKGETKAELFYVAYAREPAVGEVAVGEAAGRGRPVTFVFNGGPGAASAFLQLGALGPRTLVFAADGSYLPPPARIEDNPGTWLAFTDLVFVDPVGTGYSRALGGDQDAAKQFWGVKQDADSVADFIRLWLARAGRTDAPLFLVGESYGGFRAAILTRTLQERAGLSASGVVMISPLLEYGLLADGDFRPLPWALRLPSLAAVDIASRHPGDPAALPRGLEEVERFALSDYLLFLARGEGEGEAADAVYGTLARFTGLPEELVARQRGRLSTSRFLKEYARDRGLVLSRYDGTITAPDTDPGSAVPRGPDPVLEGAVPIWTTAFTAYVRDELGYRTDLPYRLLARDVGRHWDYGTSATRQGYAGALDDLQSARSVNPSLRALIAHGYTDLVTPYFASRYLVGQLPPLAGAVPIEVKTYPGGHMLYMRADSRRALRDDAAALYRAALAPRP